jgi:leader peptidase (prepilin peptidase) / N-methyltransferase
VDVPMPEAAWFIVVWLIVVGAAVGSFLNVVVYRLPMGISLVHPPSHCPKCGKHIPWYDNVPVLGWIVLRGRCRQCHNPISMRYPLVEAITAAMFGAVALVEMSQFDMSELYAIYPYHLLLLCTLLGAGLIEYDGHQPPMRLFVPTIVAGMTVILLWPALRPTRDWPVWLIAMGSLGIPSSLVVVWREWQTRRSIGLLCGLVCLKFCLGWPAGGAIAAGAVAFYLLVELFKRRWPRLHVPPTMLLAVFTLAWILVWARLVSS